MIRQGQNIYFKDTEGLLPLYLDKVSAKEGILNQTIIEKIESQTDLVFTPGNLEAGNVCLANNDEVLPAFRTSFSTADLLNYARGIQKSQIFIERGSPGEIHLPYPGTSEFFWQQAILGKR